MVAAFAHSGRSMVGCASVMHIEKHRGTFVENERSSQMSRTLWKLHRVKKLPKVRFCIFYSLFVFRVLQVREVES